MTESIEQLKEQGLSKVMAYIETAEGFVVEHAPLLIQEVLRYDTVYALFWACFWLVCASGAVYFGRKLYRYLAKDGGDPFPGFMLGFFGTMGCLAGTFCNVFTVVKITIAPRLYILERLDSLL